MRDTVRTSRQNTVEPEHLRINKMYNFLHHLSFYSTYSPLIYHLLFLSLVYLLTMFVYPHLSPTGGSYESICKKHIQSFMDGAEQYARYVRTPTTQHTHSDTHTLVVTHAILPIILLSFPTLQGDTIVKARG